jgi:hypothetical protein
MQLTLLSITKLLLLSDTPVLLRRSSTVDLPVVLLLPCSATCIAAGRFNSASALACLLLGECMLLLVAWLMLWLVCTVGGGWGAAGAKVRNRDRQKEHKLLPSLHTPRCFSGERYWGFLAFPRPLCLGALR